MPVVTARKAGAAEDICGRVAAAPAALREQLDGPRLLKQQIYYPEVWSPCLCTSTRLTLNSCASSVTA